VGTDISKEVHMPDSLLPPEPETTALTQYKPAAGLIKRGLDDALQNLLRRAKTLRVPIDCQTVQMAVDSASEGDIVEILSGEYVVCVRIEKGIHLRGLGDGVVLRNEDDTAPLLFVGSEQPVHIQNLVIDARRTTPARGEPMGIRVESGELSVTDCVFKDWGMERGQAQNAEESLIQNSPLSGDALHVSGHTARVDLTHCRFVNCVQAFYVDSDEAQVHIMGCRFEECVSCVVQLWGQKPTYIIDSQFTDFDTALELYGVLVVSRSNSFRSRQAWGAVYLDNNTRLQSEGDCFITDWLIAPIRNTTNAILEFVHATAWVHGLLRCPLGSFSRAQFSDSIVSVSAEPGDNDDDGILGHDLAGVTWNDPNLRLFHSAASENDIDKDVYFGSMESGCLSLRPNSPALNAASDGTHLGAWQGTPL
jgi:hypothetical protein